MNSLLFCVILLLGDKMKNIIICGLIGTGKTTLAKIISKELGYKYVDLNNKIYASQNLRDEIDNLLKTLDKCAIDCEYLILPEQYILYKNREECTIVYLGFNNVDINVLYDKFVQDYKNKNIKYDEKKLMGTLKYFKDISKKVCDDCNKYGFKFFDICKDKNLVIQEAYEYILDCITKKH